MYKNCLRIIAITVLILGFTQFNQTEALEYDPGTRLTVTNITQPANLDGQADLAAWFTAVIDYPIGYGGLSPTHFGAYVFQPFGDYLYVGIGAGTPAEGGGAQIAKYDSNYNLIEIYSPTEDGIHDMDLYGNKVYVPGSDPGLLDNQDAGNEYIIDTSDDSVTKMRYNPNSVPAGQPYLPNVIHSWGHWLNQNGELYITTGSATGATIYKSATPVSDPSFLQNEFTYINNLSSYHTGSYRAMDIVEFDGVLFSSSRAAGSPPSESTMKLFKSLDDGANWTEVTGVYPDVYSQFITYNDQLVFVGVDYNKFYVFTDKDTFTQYTFDDFEIAAVPLDLWGTRKFVSVRNMVATEDFLYAVSSNGGVYRAIDFAYWEKVSEISDIPASISYWGNKNQIIVSSYGSDGAIFTVDLAELAQMDLYVYFDRLENALGNVTAELLNSDGTLILRTGVTESNGTLNIDKIMPGSYLLRLRGADKNGPFTVTQKVILSTSETLELNIMSSENNASDESYNLAATGFEIRDELFISAFTALVAGSFGFKKVTRIEQRECFNDFD